MWKRLRNIILIHRKMCYYQLLSSHSYTVQTYKFSFNEFFSKYKWLYKCLPTSRQMSTIFLQVKSPCKFPRSNSPTVNSQPRNPLWLIFPWWITPNFLIFCLMRSQPLCQCLSCITFIFFVLWITGQCYCSRLKSYQDLMSGTHVQRQGSKNSENCCQFRFRFVVLLFYLILVS